MGIIKNIARLLLKPIALNAVFFVTMYVLGVLCAFLTLPEQKGSHLYDNLFSELFLDIYLACMLLSLIPSRVRRWVRALFYVVLYAVAIIDVFCFWKFSSSLTPTMLLLVGETNSREAGDFFNTYLSTDVIFSPIGWLLLLILFHILFVCRQWLYKFIPENYKHLLQNATEKLRLFACRFHLRFVGGIAVLALFITGVINSYNNKVQMTRLMTADTIGTVEHILTEQNRACFYLPIYRLAFSVYSNHLASQQVNRCIAAAKTVKVDSCSYQSPNIVLIIGESYGKVHSQLYGYKYPTTPRQVKLERSGLLTRFSDVVSCWNLTSFVFKNVLSMHVVGQKGEWCDYALFPELFKKAGYNVTFLTNQFLPQAKEAIYDFSGGFFLNNPELSKFLFTTRNNSLHRFDEGLLADYDGLVKSGEIVINNARDRKSAAKDPNFIIFHLIGQHVNYRTRVPNDRRVFTAADYAESRPDLSERRRRVLADYDNACLYNDSIVASIIKRFENTNSIVIYMPDHGEECYEPGRNFICRNHSADVDWPLAHYEFEVPFWIYCTHRYAVTHPEIFKAIKDAKDKRFMTDALPHMLVWLAGISAKDYRPEYNLLSPQYNERRPRILKHVADYDKLRDAERARELKAEKKK
ncbi:MAG: phosphoethanolamine transferase [Prevotella sp.]|nr:phosphoethanolamine transferase [Prevotella sp.]